MWKWIVELTFEMWKMRPRKRAAWTFEMWKMDPLKCGKWTFEMWKMNLWNVENGPLKVWKNCLLNVETRPWKCGKWTLEMWKKVAKHVLGAVKNSCPEAPPTYILILYIYIYITYTDREREREYRNYRYTCAYQMSMYDEALWHIVGADDLRNLWAWRNGRLFCRIGDTL